MVRGLSPPKAKPHRVDLASKEKRWFEFFACEEQSKVNTREGGNKRRLMTTKFQMNRHFNLGVNRFLLGKQREG